jgi:hypothetical protein
MARSQSRRGVTTSTTTEETDSLSREISILLSATAESPHNRNELHPKPQDWLLFDIRNKRLITSRKLSTSVSHGLTYLVVSSAMAADPKLHDIADKYTRKQEQSNFQVDTVAIEG